jgi:polysaccharide biosynthesis protein PslE
MEELEIYDPIREGNNGNAETRSLTLRDILVIGSRHRRLISLSFLGVLSGALLVAILQPNKYDAAMKILVRRDRLDTVVTADANAAAPQTAPEITEEELNSEVTLLKSRDLLEQIVLTCGLQRQNHWNLFGLSTLFAPNSAARAGEGGRGAPQASKISGAATPLDANAPIQSHEEKVAIAEAVKALDKDLKVDVIKKTNLIEASYGSPDPGLAQRVLAKLASLYIEKHVAVHRSPGAFDFFQRETERYKQELEAAQKRLLDFDQQAVVVAPPVEKELALQKLADFQVSLNQTNAAIAETEKRVSVLETQIQSMPSRMVTQVRDADDAMLTSQLKANLLGLEQKRIELLQKFEPTYRPVQEIDAQIAQARTALAEKTQLHEQTTDRDPTYEWARSELEKAKADLASLRARATVTAAAVSSYQETARSLDTKEVEQGDIRRTIKSAEDNYLLSQRKEEEARISDELDRGRILNVAIVDPPGIPALPSNHRFQVAFFGLIFATIVSGALVFAVERTDSTFRTPAEVGSILNIPVLAAISQRAIRDGGSPDFNSLVLSVIDHKGRAPGDEQAT